jgi:hypothetical protein
VKLTTNPPSRAEVKKELTLSSPVCPSSLERGMTFYEILKHYLYPLNCNQSCYKHHISKNHHIYNLGEYSCVLITVAIVTVMWINL